MQFSIRLHACMAAHVSAQTEADAPHVVEVIAVIGDQSLHEKRHVPAYCQRVSCGFRIVDIGTLLPVCYDHIRIIL